MPAKAKSGLSNNLLGKMIAPKPEFGDPANTDTFGPPNQRIWSGLKPNASGEWVAMIDAAWVEDGVVKLAVHDAHGSTALMWFSNTSLMTP